MGVMAKNVCCFSFFQIKKDQLKKALRFKGERPRWSQ